MRAPNPIPEIHKLSRTLLVVAVLILLPFDFRVPAQGTFQNLNFESAVVPPGTQPGGVVPTASAMPGWSSTSPVYYDGISLGGAQVSLIDGKNSTPAPLQGLYSIMLFGGPTGSDTISQTGLVPSGTKSLQVEIGGDNNFVITLGGQTINMVPLQFFSSYILYGGDVASFGGSQQLLTISENAPPPPNTPPSAVLIDDIVFSPNPIPEPGACSLLLCGVGLLGAIRYARCRHR